MTPDGVLIHGVDLTVDFPRERVLDAVSLTISAREIVTLVGLNGAGKSTLVRVLLGLIRPTSGRVERRTGLRVGYVPQSVARDRSLPLKVARFLRMRAGVQAPMLDQVVQQVGLRAVMDAQLAEISGGQFHRVLLARALLGQPDLLVLDEPFASVDLVGQAELYTLLAHVRDNYGCGVLVVSHDLHLVMAKADRVVCLNRHVCCTGHPQVVSRDPAFVAMFGRHAADALAVYNHHHDHYHDANGIVHVHSSPHDEA